MEASGSSKTGPAPITRLPPETFEEILCQLPDSDIKSLRATCVHLHQLVPLRLSRVFLSPNPVNVDIFRAVADHEVFRKNIVEIVYDDARLLPESSGSGDGSGDGSDDDSDDDSEEDSDDDAHHDDVSGVPTWYLRQYRQNAERIDRYGIYDVKRPHHLEVAERYKAWPSPAESYQLYQKMLQGQDQVIAANSDGKALRYGLSRFPNLQRITLTPAAHGSLVRPWYETPMFRSLPPGLIYPLPRGWPMAEEGENYPFAKRWDGDEKMKWRGFCLVTSVAAQYYRENPTPSISEFVIDTNRLLTGINCRVFDDEESAEYKDLVRIFSRPGFRRIDLALLVGGQDEQGWHAFRNGNLFQALSKAPDLQSVKLSTNVAVLDNLDDPMETDGEHHWMPLQTIFPIQLWSNLRHFCLSRFVVKQHDLMGLLHALPSTLESVELSFLAFVPECGHYQGLLEDMRSNLGWRERPAAERPRIIIYGEEYSPSQERPINVSREAEGFVYGDGESPFPNGSTFFSDIGMSIDIFDPEFERPNAGPLTLMELGIVEMTDWVRQGGYIPPSAAS
ncbi:hypothetical protein EDB81DRAFT_916269 [Dactylonectria macrodidyma]|uniref:F-box domain-containing protein n=1 Tax=Dactylonectria macrodidyma TaxID=307937 RepID=A0A9P9IEZ2_9HYPO|nr:hypothetical protein EDB81DRAFT_916269 [Dactylonectria macrodidyma]